MLRITIEMLPGGMEGASYMLAQGVIINDNTGSQTIGNYKYGLSGQNKRRGRDPGIKYEGEVSGFPRKRRDLWALLKLVLEDAL